MGSFALSLFFFPSVEIVINTVNSKCQTANSRSQEEEEEEEKEGDHSHNQWRSYFGC